MRSTLFFTTSLSLSSYLTQRLRTLSSLHATIRRNDADIVLTPDDASKHSATVILCHGLGDTAEGWVDPAQYLARQLPHVKFVLPTAPTQPVTLNMGMSMPSWYDIVGLDSRSLELCNGLDQSMERILSLMEDEVIPNANDGHCVDYSRIVLAGFSQGGALALYTGMASTRKAINSQPSNKPQGLGLAGILIMSGYLPRSKSFAIAPGSESTPILHCHGKQDSVVPVEATELSRNHVTSLMEKMGGKKESYEVKLYSGLDHSVSMDELDDVVTFLRRVLPPTETSAPNDAVIGDPSVMSVRQLRGAIKQAGLEEQAKGMFEKSELINLLQQYLNQKK